MVVLYISTGVVMESFPSNIRYNRGRGIKWRCRMIRKLPMDVYDVYDFGEWLRLLGFAGKKVVICSNSKRYHGFSKPLAKGIVKKNKSGRWFIGETKLMRKYFSWNRHLATLPRSSEWLRQCARCGWSIDVRLYSVGNRHRLLCLKCANKLHGKVVKFKPKKKRVGLGRRVGVGSPIDFTDFSHATTYYAEDYEDDYEEDDWDEDDYEEGYEVW